MQILKTVMKEQNLKIFIILFLLIISNCCTEVHSCFEQSALQHTVSPLSKNASLWYTPEIFVSDNNDLT